MPLHTPATLFGWASADATPGETTVKRATLAILPLALLLLWTTAIRLPFYRLANNDEFFFSIIASEWLKGGLPYVATFDIKPPGLFFIYAAVESLFGASQATIKAMEIVATAAGAYGLYRLVTANGTPRAAFAAAALFPVYSIPLGGVGAVNMLLELPFVIAAFAAALAATREQARQRDRLSFAFLAGLAIGAAGMMRQPAIFEAAAVFGVLCVYGTERLRLVALYVGGAAIPGAVFAVYFLATGHFHEMFQAVILLALNRSSDDVIAGYGPLVAYLFTPLGMAENTLLRSAPLIVLWVGAWLAVRHVSRLKAVIPPRLFVVAGLWLIASLAGVFASSAFCDYYLLSVVPPLLILAGTFFAHGLELAPPLRTPAFVLSLVVAAATVVIVDRGDLFQPNALVTEDFEGTRELANRLTALGLAPEDRVFVLDRGFGVYARTGAMPPMPYFHPVHLLTVFHTPSPDPLGQALASHPRFIIVSDLSLRRLNELPSRYEEALAYVAAHYRQAGLVTGPKDSFTIYEFAG
jgi:hypothetical protein